MAFLEIAGLSKLFGGQPAVDGLDLSVERGEFVSLLGPSGCGKTTTLQMIAGFVDPTAGRITLDGGDLLKVKPSRRGLGIVFQSYALFPHMTAAENVAFGLEMAGVAREERDRRVRDTLALVGLTALADRFPRRMSGGQQQRVALARALVIEPRILLLDEPLSNLDAKLREEMQVELRQIQQTVGATTILVTHDQSEAMALSDRIVVMNAGKVEQIGPPAEVYEHPATAFVASFLGKTNVLPADIGEGGILAAIGDGSWPLPATAAPGRTNVSIRPEKIRLDGEGPASLSGTVRSRVFQGSHWLYQVESACGPVTVIRQNGGEAAVAPGTPVRLTWQTADMTVGRV